MADEDTVDIGNGLMADVMAFGMDDPGPEFRLTVGPSGCIVDFENNLNHGRDRHPLARHRAAPTPSDGTPLTQNQVPPGGSVPV